MRRYNMTTKYLLPLLAILGALFGLYTVFWTQKPIPIAYIPFPPAVSPFRESIAGAGMIEASTTNIVIGSPFNEIIKKVYVNVDDVVKAGDKLFELDTRSFEAQLATAKESVKVAEATLEDKARQFSFYKRLQDTKSVSEQIFQQANYAFIEAKANLNVVKGNLHEIEVNIERSTILAPVDGRILQVSLNSGEIAPVIPFISASATWRTAANGALIVMGDVNPLQMRVNIDEADAWRFVDGSEAVAFVRGNRNIGFPMKFFRKEPYIIPKSSFTGATIERVDTRVLQVLYRFERDELPIYTGQILDVFINANPNEESR